VPVGSAECNSGSGTTTLPVYVSEGARMQSLAEPHSLPLHGHGSKTRFASSSTRLPVSSRVAAAGANAAGGGTGGRGPDYELSFAGHFASHHDHHHAEKGGGERWSPTSDALSVRSCPPPLAADGPSHSDGSRAGCALGTAAVGDGDGGGDSLASSSDQMETQIFDVEILENGEM
jgi:hypothetical protein